MGSRYLGHKCIRLVVRTIWQWIRPRRYGVDAVHLKLGHILVMMIGFAFYYCVITSLWGLIVICVNVLFRYSVNKFSGETRLKSSEASCVASKAKRTNNEVKL